MKQSAWEEYWIDDVVRMPVWFGLQLSLNQSSGHLLQLHGASSGCEWRSCPLHMQSDWICEINSCGQLARSRLLALELDGRLPAAQLKNLACYKMSHGALYLDRFFGSG
jgi:hypothetical protein